MIAPELAAACPANSSTPNAHAKRLQALPGYQIVAIDAETGAAGVVYSARSNRLCGGSGYTPVSVAPAIEQVSVPWTLVRRTSSKSAAITYRARPCDSRVMGHFGSPTGPPVAMPSEDHPALVRVTVVRSLVSCGSAVSVPLLLRSATLKTDLPDRLVHAVLGAEDFAG